MQVSLLHDTIVVADFRELENHCFYADFKDTRVWCDGTTNDCVDKCKEKGKDPSCNVKDGGNYVKSNWLISRPNKGVDFSEPDIQGGAIYYSPGKTSNNGKSSVTYLLNRTQTGGHGTLRAAFKSCDRKWNPQGKLNPLNSGFILRSNKSASSYAIVQIYAREGQTINAGKYVMETRVCQGDADGIKNENGAKCEKKEFGIVASLTELKEIVFNTEIEVVGDSAKVILSYKKGTSWKRSSVKLPLLESASIDEYVGLSLAEDCFKVMNLGWESDDWDAEYCFDIPKVGCSFAANYLGGILPLNEDVKPWVGTSSFFNDPSNPDKLRDECTIKYHYNGCDLPMDYSTQNCEAWLDGSLHCGSCRSADSEGPYYVSGINANTLKDDKYKFTYAGLHGTSKNYTYRGSTIFGAVRDASVVVDCSDADGANSYYEATCGRFTVGSINECSQSVSFNFDNCRNQKSCVVNVSGGLANLRSSVILGEIRGLPEDGSDFAIVSMVLKDANGLKSQEYQISGNGTFSRDVNLMSDMQEFDPEKVVSIEFSSANNFTLASLSSNCPNSVGVHDCTAELDGDHFMIVTSMVNANAATCKVEGNGNPYKADEKDCPQNGRIYVPAVDLQKSVNMSGSNNRVYSFTVTVKSKENGEEETCTTAPVEVAPNEMTCSLSSTTPVNAGESLPSLNYKITNCPPSGCTVEARIGTESPQKIVYRGNGQESSWSPDNINTTAGNYRYTLTYAGLSCTADITVITGANGSSADNCAIDEVNKLFTADLNLVMGSTNTLKLWYLDKLGNTVGSSKSVSPSTTRFSESLPEIAEAGDYVIVLSINGDTACTVPYTATGEEPTPDVDCYIEGGRFKTRNKNTTGQTMYGVYLNRSTDGSQNGNTVSTQNWAVDGYVDMEAYLPPEPGTYTYSLGYAGNTFCSVTYEVKDEESSEP